MYLFMRSYRCLVKMKTFKLLSVVLFYAVFLTWACRAEKLSSAKLLLPYHPTILISSTLEVTESDPSTCYRWYSSKPGVVSVDPVEPWQADGTACSQKAIVVSKSQTVVRNQAVVFAENVQTRQVLKCHVVVEKIKSIMIESKSRELYLEDSPEPFKVLGLDEEGNIFSTLGSLPFEWLLLADAGTATNSEATSTVPSQILRLVRYADTSYDAPDDVALLEGGGARGFSVLLEGLQTGVAFISAKIKDPVYRDVAETHIKLRVVANVQLLPGEVYLMPLASASIKAFIFRQNRPSPLQLPSPQYATLVGDSKVASFDEKSAIVKALDFGATNVTLIDRNIQVKGKDDYVPPSSFVYVEKPASLRMTVVEYPHASTPWILEAGRDYEFHIDILDRLGHVLVLPDDFIINAVLPSQFFEVKKNVKNGTVWWVKTKPEALGEGQIPASADWSFKAFKTRLELTQDFVVYAPIRVHPKVFGLPLVLFGGADQFIGYQLHVTGGSGQYIFMSSDNKVATVDSNGLVRSVALEPGHSEIKVIDQRNQKHWATSLGVVGDVAELEFSPESKVEALIGNQLAVGIRAYILRSGRERIPVANCSALKLSLELSKMPDEQQDIFKMIGLATPRYDPQLDGIDCALVYLDTLRAGFSELKIRSPLPASIVISGYSGLKLDLNTEYGVSQIVTGVHTRVRLPVVGGPLVWPQERERHLVTVEQITKTKDFDFSFTWNSKLVEISAECRKYGDFDLLVTVGNVRSERNSVYEKLELKVSCPEPHSVQLSIPWGQDQSPPCPASLDSTLPFPISASDVFPVQVSVFDSNHRRFMNISSFELNWSFAKQLVQCAGNTEKCSDVIFDSKIRQNLMQLKSSAKLGLETVQVDIVGYLTQFGSHDSGLKLKNAGKLTAQLGLKIVDPARLSETEVVLFTIPAATKKIQVLDGSGYFQFNINERQLINERIASTIQSDFQTLAINPHGNGAFVVEALDLCARPGSAQRSLIADVKVLSIDKLVVIGRRFISTGETFNIGVVAMDASGEHLLPADLYSSIALKPVFAEDKITVQPANFIGDIAIFSVTGKSTGLAKLSFTAEGVASKQLLTSPQDYALEVCLPVSISPSPRLVLMDGAQYQLSILGGPVSISPKPSVTFRFVGSSDSITLDKNSGLIHGVKLGDSKLEAVLYDQDPLAARLGKPSQVEIVTPPLLVEVRHLTGIHLASPSNLVESGALIPVTVFGLQDGEKSKNFDFSPAGFGTASPSLVFSWSVSPNGPKIELLSPFFGPLYTRPLEEDFTVYFRASTPGDFVITAQVSRPGQQTFKNLTASLNLQVLVPFRIGRVQPPFTVTVGSELHLPVTGHCPFGSPKYSMLAEPSTLSCKNGSSQVQEPQNSPINLGPSNSFVGKTPGQATYLAKCSQSDFLSLSFDVKPHFSYITIVQSRDYNSTNFQSKLTGLPYGASFTFDLDYFTQQGRKFDAVSGNLLCRLNRREAVNFYAAAGTPRQVSADLSLPNSVSVVACEAHPAFPLYLSLVVKTAITPFGGQVNVGDLVCFRHAFSDENRGHENWLSSDSSNLFVDRKSGVALALRPSSRETISVDFGSGFRAATSLTVKQIASIDFRKTRTERAVLSNAATNSSLSFELQVESASHQSPKMWGSCPVQLYPPQLAQFPLPLQCELSAPDSYHRLFSVSTYFDSTSDPPNIKYNCQVRYLGANLNLLREVGISSYEDFATQEFQLRLYASLSSGHSDERAQTEISFVPNAHLYSTDLELNPNTLTANLTIAASERVLRSLVVQPSHSTYIGVTGPNQVVGQPGRFVYEVTLAAHRKVPANLADKLHVTVKIPFLNQEQHIPIHLPGSVPTSGSRDGGSHFVEDGSGLFSRFFGQASPSLIVAYIVVAVLLLLITLMLTFRGGFFNQPNFVRTVYAYDESPVRGPPTPPPVRHSPMLSAGADLDAQLLTAFRASGRTPVRPPASALSGGLSPGRAAVGGAPRSASGVSNLWSTGYVPEGNLNASFGLNDSHQR